MRFEYHTEQVCAQTISFELEDDRVFNVSFCGGCNGNLKAISKLIDGRKPEKIEAYLLGNTCGRRPTSCADQLAKAVRAAVESQKTSRKEVKV